MTFIQSLPIISLPASLLALVLGAGSARPEPLKISSIQVTQVANWYVMVSWDTDEPADSQVEYGTERSYASLSLLNKSRSTRHSVLLTGLRPGTEYHYRVRSRDRAGNLTRSMDLVFGTKSLSSSAEWHASATASSSGDGSRGSPWTLAVALAGGKGQVKPGDTIWVHEGTYNGQFKSQLNGTVDQPIIVRNYNGDRATLDGAHLPQGAILLDAGSSSYTWYWGLELVDSAKVTNPPDANSMHYSLVGDGVGVRFINNIIHDVDQGITKAPQYVYGNLIYYTGTRTEGGHGIYGQNDGSIIKNFEDNIIHSLAGQSFCFHLYGEAGQLQGFLLRGNAIWHCGDLTDDSKAGILLGGYQPVDNATITENYIYAAKGLGDRGLQLGYGDISNGSVTVTNNYFASPVAFLIDQSFNSISATGNILRTTDGRVVSVQASAGLSLDNNQYFGLTSMEFNLEGTKNFAEWRSATGQDAHSTFTTGAPPDAAFVRPNQYEPGRANVVVYNWSKRPAISVDLSSVLIPHQGFEIRNAGNYYGSPILRAVYTGEPITVSMTNLSNAQPVGFSALPSTAPEFAAFVVLPTDNISLLPDTIPPVIGAVEAASATSTTATIHWITNEASDSQVDYGTTTAYGQSSSLNGSRVTIHNVALSGLSAGPAYHYRVKSRDAAGNLAISPDFSFSIQSSAAGETKVTLEAENGTLIPPMTIASDPQASQGAFITSSVSNSGSASYVFQISNAGPYIIWARVLGLDPTFDSVYVSMDDGPEDVYDMAENTWSPNWQWTKVNGRNGGAPLTLNPRVFTLAAGSHTLSIRAREAQPKLDRLIITDDLNFDPLNGLP